MVHAVWPARTIFSIVLQGRCAGQVIVNVHHFEVSTVREALLLTDADAQAFAKAEADHWEATCKATYLSSHSNDYTIETITSQVLERPGQFEHKLVGLVSPLVTGGNVGGGATPSEDLATSGVLRWRSLIAGKSHRGRTFMGPLGADATAAGKLTAGFSGAILNYGQNFMIAKWGPGGTRSGDSRLTVYSRPYTSGQYQYAKRVGGVLTVITPPDYAGQSTNIISASVDDNVRVQRRREIGVGA